VQEAAVKSSTVRRAGLLILLAVLGPAPLLAQSKPRIAVLPLQNNTTGRIFGDRLGEAASDELTTQLVKTDLFRVIERQQFESILREQSLGMSGAVDAATAASVGKVLGVQLIVVGSITKFSIEQRSAGIGRLGVSASYSEAESVLDLRIVDTGTAEVIAVAEGEGRRRFGGAQVRDINLQRDFDAGIAQEALRPAIENVVEEIMKQRAKLASVAGPAATMQVVGVRDGQVYIDSGENGGITVGQRLNVLRVVDVIRDARGNVLDEVTEAVATLEVVRVLSQSAICRVVQGGAVREGDRVGG
jgi:curli biogenesis system outer membrane secretion channel CsgG